MRRSRATVAAFALVLACVLQPGVARADGPSVMTQEWRHLLFVHYEVNPESLRKLIPPPLQLDTFQGKAYVGIVPFEMTAVRDPVFGVRMMKPFPEINVRTYVKYGDKTGVFFLTLDTNNGLVVRGARSVFKLPYQKAKMAIEAEGASGEYARYNYSSRRTEKGAPPAEFEASYGPVGKPAAYPAGSLPFFLTNRYAYLAVDKKGCVIEAPIEHREWMIQNAEVQIRKNTMLDPFGLQIEDAAPLVQYVEEMTTKMWLPSRIACDPSR